MVPPKIKNISSKYSENILCTFKPTNMKKEELPNTGVFYV